MAIEKAFVESTKAWLPAFKFLGVGMILAGVTFLMGFGFAFANILRNVQLRGNTMAAALPELKRRKALG